MSINEQAVRQFLIDNPQFVLTNQDVLAPVDKTKVVDFREALLAKAQADKQYLQQRQQQWLQVLQENQQLSSALWESAAKLAQATNYEQVLQALNHLLLHKLDFPAYALKLSKPRTKRAMPTQCVLQDGIEWTDCNGNTCDHLPNGMRSWFEREHESFLIMPLDSYNQFLGYWVIASNEAGYFHPELDTNYLQAYVKVLSAVLARIMGVRR